MENSDSSLNDKPEEGGKEVGEGAVSKPVVINIDSCTKTEILEMEGLGGYFPVRSTQLGA